MFEQHRSTETVDTAKAQVDIALLESVVTDSKFVDDVPPSPPVLSPEEQRRVWRKIDKRILPVLSLMYMCCYLDRGVS